MSTGPRNNVITLKEVAEAAGVSVAAASKVLHGRGSTIRVGEARALVIREVAERLRYSPNALARQLRSSRTQTIGLIWEHMASIADGPLYYIHLLDGVAKALFAQHYRLTILPEVPTERPIRALCDGRLDGVIWCKMPADAGLIEELSHSNLNVVGLNAAPPLIDHPHPVVACDNEAGAGLVIDHLVELGHKRILFAVDEGWEDTPDAIARLNGMRRAMAKHGLEMSDSDVKEWAYNTPDVAGWWKKNPPHTAIFAWHEGFAGKILEASAEAGIDIPADLSVVGFDSTFYCESTKPRLTAVRQPIREMAELAANLLINLVEGQSPSTLQHFFPCALDVRDSTSAPRRARTTQR